MIPLFFYYTVEHSGTKNLDLSFSAIKGGGDPKCVRGVCEGCKARSIHCTVGDKGAGVGGIVNEGWELGV